MTTLQKLKIIEKKKCIYNIHYCRAGVGFMFYYPKKDKTDVWSKDRSDNGLSVDKYYPTFIKAVNSEYKLLKNK